MNNYKITVFCEINRDCKVKDVSFELISKAKELTQGMVDGEVQALVVGKRLNYDNIIEELSQYGADKVFIVNDDILAEYNAERYRKSVCEILEKEKPQVVLFGATVIGRELAPLVATSLKTGLTADCTGLEIADGKLETTRPTYGGKMNATILCKTSPQMATVRAGVFKAQKHCSEKETAVNFDWVKTQDCKEFTKILEFFPSTEKEKNNLNKAEIIFAGGRGLKSRETFEKLYKLAELTGASVGATRAAVDAGFADKSIQIGQTGTTVHAKIYVAFGISGAAQHLAGINSCDKIIAVNKDSEAPIFKSADFGFVADAEEIIDTLTNKLLHK